MMLPNEFNKDKQKCKLGKKIDMKNVISKLRTLI